MLDQGKDGGFWGSPRKASGPAQDPPLTSLQYKGEQREWEGWGVRELRLSKEAPGLCLRGTGWKTTHLRARVRKRVD